MTQCRPNGAKYTDIIDAAVAEFQDKGFAAASMDRVSARAGVSKRTVYKYFESKEKLFKAIIDEVSEKLADIGEIAFEKSAPLRPQLIALGQAQGALMRSAEFMAMARMLTSETLRSPETAKAAQDRIDKTSAIAAMIADAARDGRLEVADPQEVAHEFLGLIKAKAFWPVIFGGAMVSPEDMQRIVEGSVDMILSRYAQGRDPKEV